MNAPKRTLLSVAGFDPSGGAGVLLDAAVFRRLGFHGAAVVTALTIQNTASVQRVVPMSPRLVRDQWRSLAEDIPVAGIKVGMVGTGKILRIIAAELGRHNGIPRVVDPVLRSSSGTRLLEREAVPAILRALRGRANLVTPNLAEASCLAGFPVRTPDEMERAARELFERTGVPFLIKGGHLAGTALDVLYDGSGFHRLAKSRIPAEVHGTGCCLAAAVTAFLALGYRLDEACRRGTKFVHAGLVRARRIGRGRPVFDV